MFIPGDFKSNDFVSAHSRALTDVFLATAHCKGLTARTKPQHCTQGPRNPTRSRIIPRLSLPRCVFFAFLGMPRPTRTSRRTPPAGPKTRRRFSRCSERRGRLCQPPRRTSPDPANIAIVCCRACKSTPIIRILASFDPSAAHFVAPASSRPWMALDGPGNMTPSTRSRGYLPHLEGKHPIYFVTFRLADSLPRELVVGVRKQREALEKTRAAGASVAANRARLQELRALLQKVERCLDSGLGACYMRDFRIAKIVADAIRHFHGKRYQVLAWCVMPNHVHVVFYTLGERKLEAILHSWKSFSAQGANRLLGRSGGFWQREYFDHLVRNEASLSRIITSKRTRRRRVCGTGPGLGQKSCVARASSRQRIRRKPFFCSAGILPAFSESA